MENSLMSDRMSDDQSIGRLDNNVDVINNNSHGDHKVYSLITYYFQLHGGSQHDIDTTIDIIKKQPFQGELESYDYIINVFSMVANNFILTCLKLPAHILNSDRHQHIQIDLSDNGTVCVCVFYPSNYSRRKYQEQHNDETPALYLFPGITQCHSSFSNLICECVEELGWSIVIINRRGLCEKLTTPTFHIAGNDADTHHVMGIVRKHHVFKDKKIFALGISMGGLVLARYLGKYVDRQYDGIVAAATICAPLTPRDVKFADYFLHTSLADSVVKKFISPYQHYVYDFEFPSGHPSLLAPPSSPSTWLSLLTTVDNSTALPLVQDDQIIQPEEIIECERIANIRNRMKNCNNIYELMFHNLLMIDNPIREDSITPENDVNTTTRSDHRLYREMCKKYGIGTLRHMIRNNHPEVWTIFPGHDCAANFKKINVPILMIHTMNDPIISISEESKQTILSCPNATHIITKSGSHVYLKKNMFDVGTSWGEKIFIASFRVFDMPGLVRRLPKGVVPSGDVQTWTAEEIMKCVMINRIQIANDNREQTIRVTKDLITLSLTNAVRNGKTSISTGNSSAVLDICHNDWKVIVDDYQSRGITLTKSIVNDNNNYGVILIEI